MTEQTETEQTEIYTFNNWDELEISPKILRGLYGYGFERPSPIQSKAIIPIVKGKDIIAQAQAGTGKTGAFTVGMLTHIDTSINKNQALILCPTHELANQIASVVRNIGSLLEGLRVQVLIGGSSIDDIRSDLKKNPPHVIVGCPGRVHHMESKGLIRCSDLKLIILDEADEMLSSSFKDQVYNIFRNLNSKVQVCLFSATIPENMYTITSKFMQNPFNISVMPESLTLEGIQQYFIALENDEQKYETLKDLFSNFSVNQCFIYCNSVKRVSDLYDAMIQDKFPVCCIHSDMDKEQREKSFTAFRTGETRVMISSNVTARGIDIQSVSVVINFDVPKDIHTYIHRIGRSGRWGKKGVGLNFVTRRDISKLKEIERYYMCSINEFPADFNFMAHT
jgi:translation initiation factor 4A